MYIYTPAYTSPNKFSQNHFETSLKGRLWPLVFNRMVDVKASAVKYHTYGSES